MPAELKRVTPAQIWGRENLEAVARICLSDLPQQFQIILLAILAEQAIKPKLEELGWSAATVARLTVEGWVEFNKGFGNPNN